jgi:curved DNA-binding protein CbpA
LRIHPDKTLLPGAAAAFKEVNQAHAILSDHTSREVYDHFKDEAKVRRAKAREQAEEAEAEQERERKQAQEERKREEQQRADLHAEASLQALARIQAQQVRQLVVEGLEDDSDKLMGVYKLMEGRVVSWRAVWQKQGGAEEWFLYYSSGNNWVFSTREHMEDGSDFCYMALVTAALTPNQTRPSDVWKACNAARTQMVDVPEVQVRHQI